MLFLVFKRCDSAGGQLLGHLDTTTQISASVDFVCATMTTAVPLHTTIHRPNFFYITTVLHKIHGEVNPAE